MNAITSCYADLSQKESGWTDTWTDTPKKTLHIWLIGPILCLGRSLAIEPQNSYLSRNWTVFTPWKFLPPRSLLELVQLAIAFYEKRKNMNLSKFVRVPTLFLYCAVPLVFVVSMVGSSFLVDLFSILIVREIAF